jgi:murein DD-endopeptidase MepM/ murein hydrolase activator NlpD
VIAQRFAVDWIQFDADGRWYHGDAKLNISYVGYGQPAVAVADGEIVSAKDGVPENVPGQTSTIPFTLETVMGNSVILKINDTTYALYAHFIPGSVRVGVGDGVKKGDVLGLIGNSGNSTAPHLHFHLSQRPKMIQETQQLFPLFANGIPFALDTFILQKYSVVKSVDDLPEHILFGEQKGVQAESIMTNDLISIQQRTPSGK